MKRNVYSNVIKLFLFLWITMHTPMIGDLDYKTHGDFECYKEKDFFFEALDNCLCSLSLEFITSSVNCMCKK
jgi:hypothetical protein